MKRTFLIGTMVLGFVFVANIVFGNFYVIPTRPRIAGTEITSLPYTITSSGFYFITRDLNSTGDGITVNANNVTIDLMGFSLIGPGKSSGKGTGIYMDSKAAVEVRNGIVRGFGNDGVFEECTVSWKGRNHRIIGVRANGNGSIGIHLLGSGHLVKDCTASDNDDDGISVFSGSTVTGNTAYNNVGHGIFAWLGCTVIGNTAYDNSQIGIYLFHGCSVNGNTAYGNGSHGLFPCTGCTVIGNTAYANQDHGIYLTENSLVEGNTAYNNNQSGGGYSNISTCATCTFGTNHAP